MDLTSKKTKVDPKEENQTETRELQKKENNSSKTVGFWSIAIPAYCYFFGYSSFKYELDALGFDSPEISTAPGDVYFHAFNTFSFLGGKILPASKDLLMRYYDDNNLLIVCLSLGVAIATYLAQIIFFRKNKSKCDASERTDAAPEDQSRWVKLKIFLKAILRWSWMTIRGKGTAHSLWISRSIYIAGITYVGNFIMLPIILVFIGIIGLVLVYPPLIGLKKGQEELADYNCPTYVNELTLHRECSLITLKDGKYLIGVVYNKDAKFMYLLTKDEAKSIPLDQIIQGDRKVRTGKTKVKFSPADYSLIDQLYCPKETMPFNSSSLLKSNL